MAFPFGRLAIVVATAGVLVAASGSARAHGDRHELISMLSAELKLKPEHPDLLLERATLFFQDEDYPAALRDLEMLRRLAPGNDGAAMLCGRVHLACGRPAEAEVALGPLLARDPHNLEVLRWLSRALAAQNRTTEAIALLDRCFAAHGVTPPPDVIFERVRLTELNDARAALVWLQPVTQRHPLAAVHEEALRLEIKTGDLAAALQRLDRMVLRSPRAVRLHVRKAELLAAAGLATEASAAALCGLDALESLPPVQRHSVASTGAELKLLGLLHPAIHTP